VNRLLSGVVTVAGSLVMMGGIVAAATPAGAAPMPPPTPAAWGADARGPLMLPPVALATPMNTPAVASNANIGGLLTTGSILDRVSPTAGFSIVGSPLVTLRSRLLGRIYAWISADRAASTCRRLGPFTFGSVDLPNAMLKTTFAGTFPLPQHPARNTVIRLGPRTRIVLNLQTFRRGVRTVTALHVRDGRQTVNVAVTTCGRPRKEM